MKEIYLRVKVPDDFDLPVTSVIFEKDNMYFRAEKYVAEIQLPSEEEIRDSAEKKYPKREPTKFLQQWDKTLRRLYVEAQMELINKMKGE